MAHSEILAFVAEWYDPQPQLTRSFLIKVFTDAQSIEVIPFAVRLRNGHGSWSLRSWT